MPINYQALRGGESNTAQVPPDGNHQARLDSARLVDTNKGERLVTEWSTNEIVWTSWNRFDQTGMDYTRELLQGLGITLDQINTDDELTQALDERIGHTFEVRTSSQKGSQGDRWFTSTYVDGPALGVQELMDVPVDTGGLPPPSPEAVEGDDETIPF